MTLIERWTQLWPPACVTYDHEIARMLAVLGIDPKVIRRSAIMRSCITGKTPTAKTADRGLAIHLGLGLAGALLVQPTRTRGADDRDCRPASEDHPDPRL